MCKQMDVFALSQEAQFFLKARCARLEPWHLLPPRRRHIFAAVHVKAVADIALRCAGLSLCCVCGSSAASTSAVQLEYQQEQEERKRSMEHRQEISSSTALQCKLQPTLWNSTFPPVFFLRKWPFSPLPSQNFRLRRALLIPPRLLGGAARPESATLTVTIIHAWSSIWLSTSRESIVARWTRGVM